MSTIAYGTPAVTSSSPRLRITPRGRAVLAALIVAPLLAAAWFGFGAPAAQAGDTPVTTTTFTYVSIEPGQSLWQLAGQIAPQADPREVVDSIVALNNLPSADVQPGQELAIPQQYVP